MRRMFTSAAGLTKRTCYAIVLAIVLGFVVTPTLRGIAKTTVGEVTHVEGPSKEDSNAVNLSRPATPSLQPGTSSERGTQLHTSQSQKAIPVLLVTYFRSGSSWLGEITSQPNNTFYFFEPFKELLVQKYYRKEYLCYNSGVCRKPRIGTETLQFALSSLWKIYGCRFNTLNSIVKKNLKRMRHRKPQSSLQKWCISARHRVVKTIRVSMSDVDILLREMPTLKVVLLVRDPRGIVNSRIGGGYLHVTDEFKPHVLDLCTRMSSDVTEVERLRTQYGDRVTMVMYEAMAEDPVSAARFIYNFSNMEFTPSVEKWIDTHSHANQSNSYYGTERTDSVQVASQWRRQMAYNDVQVIDRICSNLYTTLGYLPITNEQVLKDSTVKTRQPVNRHGFL